VSYNKRVVNGVALVFTVNIIAAGLGYLARIILARNLTVSEYGLFYSLFTFVNFLAVFNMFGMGDGLVKYIPFYKAKGDDVGIRNSLLVAFSIALALALLSGLFMIIFAKPLANSFFKDPKAYLLLILFIPIMLFNNIRGLIRSAYQAFQNMLAFSLIYLAENLFILLSLLIAFSFSTGILAATWAHITLYVLMLLFLIPFFLKKTFNPFKTKGNVTVGDYHRMMRFGLPVMLAGMGGVIMLYIDTLMLTAFRSLEEVGIYNAIVPTVMVILFFGKSISAVVQPMISEAHAKAEHEIIRKGLFKLEKITLALLIPGCILAVFLSRFILNLLFGPAYTSGTLAMQILIISMIPLAIYTVHASFFSALGKPGIATKILLIAAVINVVINLFSIPLWGIIGASIASLIAYTLASIMSWKAVRKEVA
jgi:O-antigen/teichoic acid export membrane protein